ncbi:MAG: hypothetical protein ABSE73_14330 [Planctomycetota bacterium]
MKALHTIFAFCLATCLSCTLSVLAADFTAVFENIGLGGGGAMFAPSSSPHDPNLMFVNCDMSGLYRSTDGGKSWRMVDFRQTRSNTQARVLYHPKDANVLYFSGQVSRDQGLTWKALAAKPPFGDVNEMALDPESDALILVGANAGVFLTRDTGATWEKCPGIEGKVARFYIDPASPKDQRRIFLATDKGLYRSDDGGKAFAPKCAGLPWKEFRDLGGGRTAEGSKLLLYCTVVSKLDGEASRAGGTPALPDAGGTPAVLKGGVYKSEDLGEKWSPAMGQGINTKVLKNAKGAATIAQYYLLGVAEGRPELVYVSCTGVEFLPPNHETVFRSDDAGQTWRYIFNRDIRYKECNLENGWIIYALGWGWGGFHTKEDGFFVNPKHPDVAMWTDFGELLITTDGGKSWRQSYSKYAPGQAAPASRNPGRWQSAGLEVTSTWEYHFDPCNHKRHYICYTDVGFAISEDGGNTWLNNSATSGTPWTNTTYSLAFDPAEPGLVYAAMSNSHDVTGGFDAKGPGGVCASTDGGLHWKVSSQGLPNAPCRSIVLDPKSPKESRTLYCAMYGHGVYKSSDGAKTWAKKANGMDLARTNHVLFVKLHPDGTLFCAVSGSGKTWHDFTVPGSLYRSKDGGENWECISQPLKLHWTVDFDFDPRNSEVLYWAAITLPAKPEGGVYKTADGGKTWARLLRDEDTAGKGGPGFLHAMMVTVDPLRPETVYLGTHTHGLWYSADAGQTWKQFEGLPFGVANRVQFDPDDHGYIYVTTFGGGVWRGRAPGP